MIVRFSGEKYKAFNEFDLSIKPLTILLGANSCGKSAIINSLLMLSQTVDTASISESALRLNGKKVGMGESLNIIKDKNHDNILSFSFEFDESKVIKKHLDSLKRDIIEAHFMVTRFITQVCRQNKELLDKIYFITNDIDNIYFNGDTYNVRSLKKVASRLIAIIKLYRNNKEKLKRGRPHSGFITKYVEDVSFKKMNDCLTGMVPISITRLAAHKVKYSFKYDRKNSVLVISELSLFNKSKELIAKITRESSDSIKLESEVIDNSILKNSRKEITKLLNLDTFSFVRTDFTRVAPVNYFNESSNPVASYFVRVLQASMAELMNELSDLNVNHVSPLRAFPQRYYLLDKSIHHSQLNALDGTELAEVLKKNPNIKDSINLLLAEFNIAVEVEKVNDIIHKITVNQEAVHLELTDVGFGISQVLPILVQAYLSPKYSITIIEQPEIHLHPKMQAWLTDALIKIALSDNKRFLIETHSDALVRRLRLRIVDENSPLTENEVGIYHLERNKNSNCTEFKRIPISADGDITWPSDFMDVEINDTIMIQKMKLNKLLKSNGAL
ncbi:AAA family ATPase [Serratia marcescens]|uniref:AAA family ATPase n=1 Tax=Serratia marcescens TaxID=615 RepID=UPI003B8A1AD6|nr:hypothetical protein SME04J_22730 [Serratia marcescens]